MANLKIKAERIVAFLLCLILSAGIACILGACSTTISSTPIAEKPAVASIFLSGSVTSSEVEEDVRYIQIETPSYNGDLTVNIAFCGDEVYWATQEKEEVEAYVTAAFESNRLLKVTCHKAFGTPIRITVALAEYPDVSAECICDYIMQTNCNLYIGDNFFNLQNENRYGSALLITQTIHLDETPFVYGFKFFSPSYTVSDEETREECIAALYGTTFSLVPNSEEIEKLGLDKYAFNAIEGNIDELENELNDLFNMAWLESLITDGSTVDSLIEDLKNASYSVPANIDTTGYDEITYYADTVPMYILSYRLPNSDEPVQFEIYFELYELFQAS